MADMFGSMLGGEGEAADFSNYVCGTAINTELPEELKYLSIPSDASGGMEALSEEMVSRMIAAANGAYRIVMLVGADNLGLTLNMIKALHACNCGLSNNGRDLQYFIAAGWYAARIVGQHEVALTEINNYWGYVTTCEWEANQIVTQIEEISAQIDAINETLVAAGQAPQDNPIKGASYTTQSVFASCEERGQRQAAINCNRAKRDCGVTPSAGQKFSE